MDSPPPLPDVPSLDLLTSSVKEEDNDKKFLRLISVTASTDGFWGDEEFLLKSQIGQLKRKFHEERYLRVKFLPTDVTEKKIQQMLSDFPVAKIQLHRSPNSAGSANVYLEDPELFEEWDSNRTFMLRGQRIPVFPSHTQSWVCVAGFPRNFPEKGFRDLVESAGDVKNYIYMISEKTGQSKGYGMADYETREKANAARDKLKGLKLRDVQYGSIKPEEANFLLWVEMLHPKCLTFDSLHSKCLHISNLPLQYKDMANFRKIFSVVAQPPYCQIAMKNGCSLSWGLVEYNTSEDAELTYNKLYGMKIGDRTLRITYYVPGVRAIHLYGKLCATDTGVEMPPKSGNGLLPDPPAPDICNVVLKLKAQNPVFALNLGHILYTERLGNGNKAHSSGSESDEQGSSKSRQARSYQERSSRTPSPLSDAMSLPRFSNSPNFLPTPEDSAGETSPTENRVPMMPYPASGLMNQASLHQIMAAAQNYGNDPCEVGAWPYRSLPMLPVFTPFGVQAPGLYPMSMPMVPTPLGMPLDAASQTNPRLPTPENLAAHNPVINFTNQLETMLGRKTPTIPPGFESFPIPAKLENFVVTAPVTPPGYDKFSPPKKMDSSAESSPTESKAKFPSPSKIAEEALNTSGIRNLWGPKELVPPVYNRLAPNGLLEKVGNLNGGIWAPNTSPPTLKRRGNVWPIHAESDMLSVSQSKRPRND